MLLFGCRVFRDQNWMIPGAHIIPDFFLLFFVYHLISDPFSSSSVSRKGEKHRLVRNNWILNQTLNLVQGNGSIHLQLLQMLAPD